MRRVPIALTAVSVVLGLAASPAAATAGSTERSASTAAACTVDLGSVTAGGDHTTQRITATSPPSVATRVVTPNLFPNGAVRFSSNFLSYLSGSSYYKGGWVVIGSGLYFKRYRAKSNGALDLAEPPILRRAGGGWDRFTAFETSTYWYDNSNAGEHHYGMRDDGTLVRWALGRTGTMGPAGSAAGFSAVKAMALISQQATYDTFLATTRGGALYTIHIPHAMPMKPVVKKVRASTWQGFETLVAAKCGQYGTLLLGIDKDTKAGYLYAVGHANGTATVIQSRGKVPYSFADPVYHRWATSLTSDFLNGE